MQAETQYLDRAAIARQRRKDGWHDWVTKCLAGDQGKLYRWLRGPNVLDEALVPVRGTDAGAVEGPTSWGLALRGGANAQRAFLEPAWKQIWQAPAPDAVPDDWVEHLSALPAFPEVPP